MSSSSNRSVADLIGHYVCLVWTPIDKKAMREVSRLAEECKAWFLRKAARLVASAGDRPILLSYSNDGTPLRTKVRDPIAVVGTKTMRLVGSTEECLVQQALLRTLGSDGRPNDCCASRPHALH